MVDADDDVVRDVAALCLSGGGYRAMIFHAGVLLRLNEAGLLPKLSRISSVSGGSITAAYLAVQWHDLQFDSDGVSQNLAIVVNGLRKMARTNVDAGAIFWGIVTPSTIAKRVAEAYDDVLFQGKMLSDLPDDANGVAPRFVINATNIQSGALWRFSRPYMGDYRVGLTTNPLLSLSVAVAASSAFPPVLSPFELELPPDTPWSADGDLSSAKYRQKVVLSDGGVYDNLGLETLKRCRTILASDAGQKTSAEADPHHDWARHSLRIFEVVDNQVRSLRKRELIGAYLRGDHNGAYWSVRSNVADYHPTSDPLGCAMRNPAPLAEIPTRLSAMTDDFQEKLINWGYAVCDIALRTHIDLALQQKLGVTIGEPKGFPYPVGY